MSQELDELHAEHFIVLAKDAAGSWLSLLCRARDFDPAGVLCYRGLNRDDAVNACVAQLSQRALRLSSSRREASAEMTSSKSVLSSPSALRLDPDGSQAPPQPPPDEC